MATIGRFELLGKLGKGAFGEVFKGRDPKINRVVAIKLVSDTIAADPTHLARFLREAESAGGLNHRNIVTIYELGEHEGLPFIAMEYLEGRDLATVISKRVNLPVEHRVEILIQIADGLHYAHSRGIVHRDIKPANIRLLDDGTVKIMDFGIARTSGSEMTNTGMILGTVNYMAPEMLQGGKIDARADQFSLGVTAYELLSFRRPFKGDNVSAVLYSIVHGIPEPLGELHTAAIPDLGAIVMRSLEKDPERRWPDCQAVALALREQIGSRPPSGSQRLQRIGAMLQAPAELDSGHGLSTHVLDTSGAPRSASPTSRPTRISLSGVEQQGSPVLPAAPGAGAPQVPAVAPGTSARSMLLLGAGFGAVALAAVLGFGLLGRRAGQPPVAASAPAAEPTVTVAAVAPAPVTIEPAASTVPAATPPASTPPSTPDATVATTPPAGEDAPASAMRAEIDGAARELRGLMKAEKLDQARLARKGSELRKLDPANATLLEADRLLSGLAQANAALAALDPGAAAKALDGLDGNLPAVRGVRERAAELARRRDGAAADLAKARAALESGRREEALPLARRAADSWPDLAGEAAPLIEAAARPLATVTAAPAIAAPAASTPVPAPAPKATAPDDRALIEKLLAEYARALRSEDLDALRRIWPSMPEGTAKTIARSFEFGGEHLVELEIRDLKVTGERAVAVCRRRDEFVTRDGQRQKSDTDATVELKRSGDGWTIDVLR